MSRVELVEAVNKHIWESTGAHSALTESAYAKYERGDVRCPGTTYRDALRQVLGCQSDAELGFRPTPRGRHASLEPDPPTVRNEDVFSLSSLISLPLQSEEITRRTALGAAATSIVALSVSEPWAGRGPANGRRYGMSDVARVRAAIAGFSRKDQRHGGGHGREVVARYFRDDTQAMLNGRYANEATRRAMFSTASELAYLVGWMAFDDADHAVAKKYFTTSVQLADEASDPAMAGHTLRAMAHQAVELEQTRDALTLAEASVNGDRYRAACARERSLLGVVHGRALAAAGLGGAAGATLLRAENDLRNAGANGDEPGRVFFFSEASLAHETGRALYASGDLKGAKAALAHSARARAKQPFARTHAVTLGYLGEVQAATGNLDQACATWSDALDAMVGVHSARARQTVTTMRRVLAHGRSTNAEMAELDQRAAAYLATA